MSTPSPATEPTAALDPPRTAHAPDPAKVRAAVRGGTLAYFVDQFDIYLPIVVLAPATAYFQAANLSASTTALLSSLVFASTLIGRPLGAIIFGHFADTVGRKRTTLVAVGGFGTITLATACLPGHETIGVWSVGLLIALRFVDGIFLGGEYTTAVPLAMEWSPRHKRGLYASIITSTSPGAYVMIAAITLLMLQLLPSQGLHSAYVQWGWRVPFVIGALLAVVLFRYYLRQVHEPPAAVTGERHKLPFVRLLARYPKALAQVFVLMTGTWLATNMEAAVTPGQLASHLHLSSKQVTLTMLVINAAAALSYPLFGLLSQRIGRRRFYIGYGLSVVVLGAGSYSLLMVSHSGFGAALGWGVLIGIFTVGTFGPIAAYLTERFPASIRSTAYGVGYSLALIAPAFYQFYLQRLDGVLPAHLAPAVLIALAGLLISLGGFLGPETKDVDMADDRTIPGLS
ncbi:MFS family permease [Amycolatopsis bartoniae]|uniref:MFS transporter n=1 Tax=Amycolatopsis bartoniae TaxID=941986 RepID=A0A8H9IQX0_9PSEU|nr:MFS transporter [Amycolatopsis bartoniae]MBB2936784.1 MFS family permease [Amycolatopsis bartoniae]TVT09168.1 MHS family MFS transporter [Amycolatopsis bartoniae]GHF50099.1 MFS transporter [Amycolatopsis bartoniae]